MNRGCTRPKKPVLIAGAMILIVLVIFGVYRWSSARAEKKEIENGTAYLKELETRDMSEIRTAIKEIESKQNLAAAEEDADAIWNAFDDAVIIGDSRAVGFSYYEFLPESQVLAESGAIITDVEEQLDTLKKLDPAQVFLCYGLNDVKSGYWPETSDYTAACEEQVKKLKEALPECGIYINSILPAVGEGLSANAAYAKIDEYNEALKEAAEENGYYFVDNTRIAEAHEDLYQKDGLHVQAEFYKYWAANMLTEVNGQ